MQRRTRLLIIWASSNQRSRELLAISRRPRCETRHTPRLTSHDDYVAVRPKVRSGPASHYEARNCSRGANCDERFQSHFLFGTPICERRPVKAVTKLNFDPERWEETRHGAGYSRPFVWTLTWEHPCAFAAHRNSFPARERWSAKVEPTSVRFSERHNGLAFVDFAFASLVRFARSLLHTIAGRLRGFRKLRLKFPEEACVYFFEWLSL